MLLEHIGKYLKIPCFNDLLSPPPPPRQFKVNVHSSDLRIMYTFSMEYS